jgi:hypothetical protein
MSHTMSRPNSRGVAVLEFSLLLGFMVFLFLGTFAIGINMIRALQVVQLGRDAGHMFARNVDFSADWGKRILDRVGTPVGLSVFGGASDAVLYLTAITYVDISTCATAGKVDASVPPLPSGCTNFGTWVFTQQFIFGDTSIRDPKFGTMPSGVLKDAHGKVTCDPVRCDYVTNSAMQVTGQAGGYLLSIRPPDALVTPGLPARQDIYVSDAVIRGFSVPGLFGPTASKALEFYGVF